MTNPSLHWFVRHFNPLCASPQSRVDNPLTRMRLEPSRTTTSSSTYELPLSQAPRGLSPRIRQSATTALTAGSEPTLVLRGACHTQPLPADLGGRRRA